MSTPVEQSLAHAAEVFAFLGPLGFEPAGHELLGLPASFRSGWTLRLAGPALAVRLLYSDWQLEVWLERGTGERLEFFTLDALQGRPSGYQGNMFPPDKLPAALTRVAAELRSRWLPLLQRDDSAWRAALRQMTAPVEKRRLP